jgi:diguanylate cyclase (GGDEF)-like protein
VERNIRSLPARLEALGPRHLVTATRTAAIISTVSAVITTVFAFVAPAPSVPHLVNAVAPLALVATTLGLLRARSALASALCVLTPLIGVGLIIGLDLVTNDASAAAQVFFCLPVLYAASQLRVAGTVLVTLSALAGNAIVSLTLLPTTPALTDVAYVGVTLVLTAALLARAGIVQDRLTTLLQAQAAIDHLTGLVTRRVLDDATRSAISGAAAQTGTALVLIDVDRFKRINDTYGHLVGDDALTHVASVLTGLSRTQDVVARMGGDELAVLMPGCTYDVAIVRAEEFVEAVRDTPFPMDDGSCVNLSISAGVAHAPRHAYQVRDLYSSADMALYQAKRSGRDRVGEVPAANSLVDQPPSEPRPSDQQPATA